MAKVSSKNAGRVTALPAFTLTLTAQIERFERLDDTIRSAASDGVADTAESLNYEFYRAINTAAGSSLLAHLLGRTTRYVPRRFYGRKRGWLAGSAEEYAPMVDALAERWNLGRLLTETHMRDTGEFHVNRLAETGPWASPRPARDTIPSGARS